MIDSRELMRGNYVLFSQDSTLFQITEISEKGLGVKNETEETWIEIDQFNPIPITEQWLRDFGFEFIEDLGDQIDYCHSVSECYLSIFKFKGDVAKYLLLTKGTVESASIIKEKMQHIHQLQNWYYILTGEELVLNKKVNA